MKFIKSLLVFILIFSVIFCFAGCKEDSSEDGASSTSSPTQSVNSTTAPYSQSFSQVQEAPSLQGDAETSAEAADTTNSSINTSAPFSVTTEGTFPITTNPYFAVTTESSATAPVTEATENSSQDVLSYTESFQGIKHTVFYPGNLSSSKTKYPVVAWANGTGVSYTIYEELIKEIAKGGYVVVANDETMAADGTAQISSIDFVVSESSDSTSPLYKKVNTQLIGVAGHSQGGRSSVNAAAKDSRIDCVISFAGSNFVEEAELLGTPTLFLAGGSDLIVDADSWIVPAYEACTGTAVYVSLKGARHLACSQNPEKYTYYAINWLDAWLKEDTDAKKIFKADGELSRDTQWTDYCSKGF